MNLQPLRDLIIPRLPRMVNILILASVVIVNFSHHQWSFEERVIEWDIKSYYAYLPAAFIYRDPSLEFRKQDMQKFGDLIWPVETPTGKQAIITTMGMSFLYSPFFLMAHGMASLSEKYEADGYTKPYKFALVFSALFYLALGLHFLRRILQRYFGPLVTAFTLLAVAVGTNLYFYATYSAAMPHVYNFSLITLFLFLVIRFYENPSWTIALYTGLLGGLITLIRPTNILVLVILFFWETGSIRDFRNRIRFYLQNLHLPVIMAVVFILVWVPQFLYWKQVSGQYFYFSYGETGGKFFWGNPQIINILFSYKKGWFVYTPVMLFAFAGIFFLVRRMRGSFFPVLIFTLLNIYVLSSWWAWWYGGAFGLRAFVDSYGIMALPLAALIDFSWKQKKFVSVPFTLLLVVLIWYNTFQIRQYNNLAIHYWWMNKEAYRENFLRLRPTERYWEIITLPDYEKARQGIYVEIKPDRPEKKRLDASEEEIIQAILPDIANNPALMDSLEAVSIKSNIPVDSLVLKRAVEIAGSDSLESYRRKIIVMKLEEFIRNDAGMLDYVMKKARKRKIPPDSMIRLDAVWLYENDQY